MMKIGFIGAGTVGTALAVRLSAGGYSVEAVSSRSWASAERLASAVSGCQVYDDVQSAADAVELVFITTPDAAIAQVASQVCWHAGQAVVHCSGADSIDILEPARQLGAQVGAFHPLQTFASIDQAIENLSGSAFGLEAEEPLLGQLKQMAVTLRGHWFELKAGDKVLYHAAAVFACNYMVTLVKLATDLWQVFGVSSSEATQALLPLMQGTLNNIGNVGLPGCLTGPIARGDLGTIKKHVDALEERAPALLFSYQELGLQTIPIAVAKGRIDQKQAEGLSELLHQT